MTKRYRILGPRRKYWSSFDDWVDLHGASSFSQAERDTLPLPDAGEWQEIDERLILYKNLWWICYRGAINLSQQDYKNLTGEDTEHPYREHDCWFDRDNSALVCLVGDEQRVVILPPTEVKE